MRLLALSILLTAQFAGRASTGAAQTLPVPVRFPSADGSTTLVGYLFLPATAGLHGAIVMMHGRAGAYSTAARGRYDASTLSKRHAFWGRFWADAGYVALLIDGFGPRGYPGGFGAHSYGSRPEALNEVTVRPFDAYGALAYLASRPDVDAARIALQGWSNGGSAAIATMSDETLKVGRLAGSGRFAGAVAFYPACGLHGRFQEGYRPYAPLRIHAGDADEEVSAARCRRLVERAAGGDVAIDVYADATHDFDDPGAKRQSVPANAAAATAAISRTKRFVDGLFARASRSPAGKPVPDGGG